MVNTKEKLIAKDQLRLENIFNGDEREFNNLFHENRILIKFFRVKYSSLDISDIDMAYSEACFVCYSNIKSGKLQLLSSTLKDYISRVMSFKLYDIYKSSSNSVSIEDISISIGSNDIEEDNNIRLRLFVSKFVSSLKDPCKTILDKFYLEELNYNQILPFLPQYTSINALKTRSYKCKKEVAESMAKELKENEIDF